MTKKLNVILNPHSSGKFSQKTKFLKVEQALQQAGLDYEIQQTEHVNHAVELAYQAAKAGWETIVAAGGDGTVSQVVNGLLQANCSPTKIKLGVIPVGTANDFANMLRLPQDLPAACERLSKGFTRLIDVGQVNGHYFINNSAIGLEPQVTLLHERMRWMSGTPRYLMAALRAIIRAKPWEVCLEWPGGYYEGTAILVSVGNSPRTGGLFFMTPEAKMSDGLLDFVLGVGMPRLRLLWLLPQTLTGQHVKNAQVIYKQASLLRITTTPATPLQADGEIIDRQVSEIEYTILPKRLQVIT